MKRQFYVLFALVLMGMSPLFAQTTITTTGITGNGTGSASPPPAGVCFSVQNTNSSAIVLTEVGYSAATNASTELWYSSTSLTGNTGPITSTSTSWTLLATVSSPTVVSNTVITTNFFSGLSLNIPANTTYRFAVTNSIVRYCASIPSQTVFTSNGVNLDITNTLWGGATFSGGLSISGRYYFGSITFIPAGPPCPGPTGLNASNVLSNSATLSWNAVASSQGYEYIVDQNATVPFPNTPTATTSTSVNKTGLNPSTSYYLHVRNKCATNNYSPWVDYQFTTLPPCDPPIGFNVTNLTTTSATVNWAPWLSAQSYDYIIDQSNQNPVTTTGITNTMLTTAPATPLTENTWYFVHIRCNCGGGQQSSWSLDSFLTPIPCRPPTIKIDHINTDEAVAYWDPVPTALDYEYALTTSATPPTIGTKYNYTSIHVSALYDGKDYYIHVRSHCNSIGIESLSDWGSASFKTFPTSVRSTADNGFSLIAYPNPVKGTLVISINGSKNGQAFITMTDIAGRIVHQAEITAGKISVDMSRFAPGMYLIKYTDQSRSQVLNINKE